MEPASSVKPWPNRDGPEPKAFDYRSRGYVLPSAGSARSRDKEISKGCVPASRASPISKDRMLMIFMKLTASLTRY